jgi:hypothetical protein
VLLYCSPADVSQRVRIKPKSSSSDETHNMLASYYVCRSWLSGRWNQGISDSAAALEQHKRPETVHVRQLCSQVTASGVPTWLWDGAWQPSAELRHVAELAAEQPCCQQRLACGSHVVLPAVLQAWTARPLERLSIQLHPVNTMLGHD